MEEKHTLEEWKKKRGKHTTTRE